MADLRLLAEQAERETSTLQIPQLAVQLLAAQRRRAADSRVFRPRSRHE